MGVLRPFHRLTRLPPLFRADHSRSTTSGHSPIVDGKRLARNVYAPQNPNASKNLHASSQTGRQRLPHKRIGISKQKKPCNMQECLRCSTFLCLPLLQRRKECCSAPPTQSFPATVTYDCFRLFGFSGMVGWIAPHSTNGSKYLRKAYCSEEMFRYAMISFRVLGC